MKEVMLVIEAVKVLNELADNFEEFQEDIKKMESIIKNNDGEVPQDLIDQITNDRKDAVKNFLDNIED